MSGSEQRDDTGLKARMRDRQALTGAFVPAPSPELVEIAAHAGYDFVVLDAEHGPLDFADIRHMIRAAQAVGVPVLVREAREQRKELLDHAAHLTIHGVLHSLGYDHVKARDARRMETLETATLAAMGIADPYVEA